MRQQISIGSKESYRSNFWISRKKSTDVKLQTFGCNITNFITFSGRNIPFQEKEWRPASNIWYAIIFRGDVLDVKNGKCYQVGPTPTTLFQYRRSNISGVDRRRTSCHCPSTLDRLNRFPVLSSSHRWMDDICPGIRLSWAYRWRLQQIGGRRRMTGLRPETDSLLESFNIRSVRSFHRFLFIYLFCYNFFFLYILSSSSSCYPVSVRRLVLLKFHRTLPWSKALTNQTFFSI